MNIILYNTTFAIEAPLEKEVMKWLEDEFIPSAIDDGYFLSTEKHRPSIFKVMCGESGQVTLAVHLYTSDTEIIDKWYADHGSRLFSNALECWQGRVVFFSTTLHLIYEG